METDIVDAPVESTTGEVEFKVFRPEVISHYRKKKELITRNRGSVDETGVDADTVEAEAAELGRGSVSQNIFSFPRSGIRQAPREITLQEWEGRVVQLEGRIIVARLVDITAGEKEEREEVELPIDDVTEADQALLQPGAMFRWVLGYSYASGRKERFARVVVRRLPVFTDREMREADREARELHNAIFGCGEDRAASAS